MNTVVYEDGPLKGMVEIVDKSFVYSLTDYRSPESWEGLQCNFEEGTKEHRKLLRACREIARNIKIAKRLMGT